MASAEPTRNGTTAAVRLFGRHAASQATPARAVPEVPAHDARGADDDAVAREARADAGDTPRAERRVRMAKSRQRKMTRTSARKKLLPPSDPRAFFVANFGPSVPSSDPSARGATTMLRLAAFLALLLPVSAGTGAPPRHPARVFSPPAHASIPPPITQCDERWRDAPLDHFSFSSDATYRQRYFLCRRYAHPTDPVLFFYTGNEANVELYLNATGIMWESAERFGAALVFAEHRYYGQSRPSTYDPDSDAPLRDQLAHLTSEQAMADYATLIRDVLRELRAPDAPVVVFGGSYGGMLATWMRIKYPSIVDAAVAGSAPVWSFEGEDPPVDPGAFAMGVTHDATAAGGASPACASNVRKAFAELRRRGDGDDATRASLATPLRACPGWGRDETRGKRTSVAGKRTHAERRTHAGKDSAAESSSSADPAPSREAVASAMEWLQSAFDYLAMGNFPYPSGYILNGDGTLPAYPFRVACEGDVADPNLERRGGDALVAALVSAAATFYNHSGDAPCFDYDAGVNPDTDEDGKLWDWQFCTEMHMPTSRDGVEDMFWPQPWNATEAAEGCAERWGVRPKPLWADTTFGGKRLRAASNVAWSNGNLDPWARLGVTESLSENLVAVHVLGGAHHLDFMWSRPDDIPGARVARDAERALIARWIDEKRTTTRAAKRSAEGKENTKRRRNGARRAKATVVSE